jgi:hypothetical protein
MTKHRQLLPGAAVAAAALALALTACSPAIEGAAAGGEEAEPAKVEPVKGTHLHLITLSELAAKRLGIRTAKVEDHAAGGRVSTGRAELATVPHSAVIYDAGGGAWTYVSPRPLTFVRHRVVVDHIADGLAYLSAGPRSGTAVVTVGVPELWGSEYEVGE